VRIASLVPSATETLFALGLGDQVVAVTHECDYPPEAASKPRLTATVLPPDLAGGEIDAEVRRLTGEGRHLYELDRETLLGLDAGLIVTQALCEVCAVSYEDLRAVAARLPTRPQVISLDPERLGDVLDDLERLGRACGAEAEARSMRASLDARLRRLGEKVARAPRPRVLALEWLDPPFVGGHWIPEMIEIAGGEDPLGVPGARSRTAGWEELAGVACELVVAMPCGWDASRARAEVLARAPQVKALGAERVVAVDAAASFSRSGPRLVEGTELLAHLLHPDRVEAPSGVAFEEVAIERLARAG
jgi:iron complex transport system substrate-binding protein